MVDWLAFELRKRVQPEACRWMQFLAHVERFSKTLCCWGWKEMLNPQSDLCGCAWGQKESIAIAINRLGCTINERLAGLLYYTMLLELSLACWYFVARFHDVIGLTSCVTATYFPPFWGLLKGWGRWRRKGLSVNGSITSGSPVL